MKVRLTEEGLKVNDYECKSITVYKLGENEFEGTMFDVKGWTTKKVIVDRFRNKSLKTMKLRKSIKSKSFEYDGIPPKSKSDLAFHVSNDKGQYINYYDKTIKKEIPISTQR